MESAPNVGDVNPVKKELKNKPVLLELDYSIVKEIIREAARRKIEELPQPTESAVIRDALSYYRGALQHGEQVPNLPKVIEDYRRRLKVKTYYLSKEDKVWIVNEKMMRTLDEFSNAHQYSIIEEAAYLYLVRDRPFLNAPFR